MASLPQLWGVLYAHPNRNGERKRCSNCRFFGNTPTGCDIFTVGVTEEMVCGYHVEEMADPEVSGLETVPEGTSCDTCKFYRPQDRMAGVCTAVVGENGGPAPVEAMGCCARWEAGEVDPGQTDGY